jgi:hypothetical protein
MMYSSCRAFATWILHGVGCELLVFKPNKMYLVMIQEIILWLSFAADRTYDTRHLPWTELTFCVFIVFRHIFKYVLCLPGHPNNVPGARTTLGSCLDQSLLSWVAH